MKTKSKPSVKKFLITSIQYNATPNRNFLRNIQLFLKDNKVDDVYVFVMRGKYIEEETIHPEIATSDFKFVNGSLKLNSNLRIYDTKILPQQINPFTGMNKKLPRNYSYILPSPKIRYESIAGNSKYPRAFISTGSLTQPNYKVHTAHGRKAESQHQYGFVYVEIQDNKVFKAHQIEATKKGDFCYLGKKYHTGNITKEIPEALILGDWHTGDTDVAIRRETLRMIDKLQPKRIVFHDFFNGHSINHHTKGLLLEELRTIQVKRIGLEDELKAVFKEMLFFANKYSDKEIIIVRSNHDDFLDKYIQEKLFMSDYLNFLFIVQLIGKMVDRSAIPLREALSLIGEIPKNVKFLQVDESLRIQGVELANHGHLGANGSRGTPAQFNNMNLKAITAHTHSPKLMENGMVVGTSTRLRLDYNRGASSWLNAHGILYSNGKYGLLPMIR
jgi:hypothetical protein